MKRDRYQTYVIDTEFDRDPKIPVKHRNTLGPDYQGGPPVAWMDGHALRQRDALLDFVREIAENGHLNRGEDWAEAAEKLMDDLEVG